ncbi:putative glutamine amidotransferase [Alphaproteobacteria bacterium]
MANLVEKDAHRPVIGITIDYHGNDPTYSPYQWYALRMHYVTALERCGAIPILLPYCPNAISRYTNLIDGVLISGSSRDINPVIYGENLKYQKMSIMSDDRIQFELGILLAMLDSKKAILGICGGMQLINVAMGGSLIQDIPSEIHNHIEHKQTTPRHLPSHNISIAHGTLLYSVVRTTNYKVNSSHHQAVKILGQHLIVNAIADDGAIEGIEMNSYPFCVGVEWHPEFCFIKQDMKLIEAFVDVCGRR